MPKSRHRNRFKRRPVPSTKAAMLADPPEWEVIATAQLFDISPDEARGLLRPFRIEDET